MPYIWLNQVPRLVTKFNQMPNDVEWYE